MELIKLLAFTAAGLYLFAVTWVFYLAVMNIKRHKDKLTTPAKVLAYPVVAVGYVFDVALNWTVGTAIFFEIPRELVLTHRLKRHKANSKGWRLRRANWICSNLLDPFDPAGSHCN